jgi:hypothetical protein
MLAEPPSPVMARPPARDRIAAARRWIERVRAEPRYHVVVETLARAGYAARGFLYLSMGLAALLAAAGLRHHAANGFGVLKDVASWPLGFVWVSAVGLALAGFSVWRAAQVVFDHDRQGERLKAIFSRAGQAISGLVYGGLALSVFDLLDAIEDSRHSAQHQAAEILAWPGGQVVLVGVGLFALGCGVGNIVQAATQDFARRLSCPGLLGTACGWIGRVGYAARGFAFLPLGVFLVEAGMDLDARQARDFGESLQSLQTQPFGSLVMGLTAVGLIAFGVFAFIEARYRLIPAR